MNRMSNGLNEIMFEAVSEALENMAFMEVILSDNIGLQCDNTKKTRWAKLRIKAPVQGEFCLVISEPLILEIVEAIYSLPSEEFTDKFITDTLGELLNIIAGRFFYKTLPKDRTFTLGLPRVGYNNYNKLDQEIIKWNFTVGEKNLLLIASGKSLLEFLSNLIT
ncbi:MAG: chemotaxis protein CheX [bacterium]